MQSILLSEVSNFKDFNHHKYSCFDLDDSLFKENSERTIFFGNAVGEIHLLKISDRQVRKKLKAENLSLENKHSGGITCLKVINFDKKSGFGSNILASGSSDRCIKLWAISENIFIQKLFGHDGTVSSIIDGFNGTILSCSIDGCFKMWSPGKGRSTLFKYPFYECTFSYRSLFYHQT
jgi:WD40 repeat protein